MFHWLTNVAVCAVFGKTIWWAYGYLWAYQKKSNPFPPRHNLATRPDSYRDLWVFMGVLFFMSDVQFRIPCRHLPFHIFPLPSSWVFMGVIKKLLFKKSIPASRAGWILSLAKGEKIRLFSSVLTFQPCNFTTFQPLCSNLYNIQKSLHKTKQGCFF